MCVCVCVCGVCVCEELIADSLKFLGWMSFFWLR